MSDDGVQEERKKRQQKQMVAIERKAMQLTRVFSTVDYG